MQTNFKMMFHKQPQQDVPDEVWMKRLIESYRHNEEKLEKLTAYAKALEEENLRLQSCKKIAEDYRRLEKYAKGLEEENAQLNELMEKVTADGPRVFKENEELRKMLRMNKSVPSAMIMTKPLRSKISLMRQYINDLKAKLTYHRLEIPTPRPIEHPLNGVDIDEVERIWIEQYLDYSKKPEKK